MNTFTEKTYRMHLLTGKYVKTRQSGSSGTDARQRGYLVPHDHVEGSGAVGELDVMQQLGTGVPQHLVAVVNRVRINAVRSKHGEPADEPVFESFAVDAKPRERFLSAREDFRVPDEELCDRKHCCSRNVSTGCADRNRSQHDGCRGN